MNDILTIFWILLLLQLFVPAIQRRLREIRRAQAIRGIERKNGSRVVTIIHRQETLSFLGLPIVRYIDIEDSERVLRAIHLTANDVPIQIVLHTPGGLVLAAEQIAHALSRHPANVQVIVPHYAMSGGTMLALAADEIVMDPNAVLGPVDPQLGGPQGALPAASILAALETPNTNRDDQTLILGDIATKAIAQVRESVRRLLAKHVDAEQAEQIAGVLTEGHFTHDYPIGVEQARALGLPITDEVPEEVYALMELYPQTSQRRPGVEFIPLPYPLPGERPGRQPKGGR